MKNAPTESQSQVHIQGTAYSGPVPPPEVIKQFEDAMPGAGERIFGMAEKDQDSALKAQEAACDFAISTEKNVHAEQMMSLWMAFIVCLTLIGTGVAMVLGGHEQAGSVALGVTAVGVVGSFLKGRRRRP